MKKMFPLGAVAALVAGFAGSASAQGVDLKVSAYGTVAAAFSDDPSLQFHRNLLTSKGVSNAIDLGSDSRFGVQVVAKFNDKISFTGQVLAQRRIAGTAATDFGQDKDLDPRVEWLYAQYDLAPSFNVRLGRTATPSFLLSDSLNVGYAAPWLRAPVHLYSSQVLGTIDGMQLNWRDSAAGFNLSAQLTYGKATSNALLGGALRTIESQDTASLNLTAEKGNWLARVGMVRLATPSAFGTIKDKYTSAGVQYDNGDLLVMAEVAQRKQNKFAVLGGKPVIGAKYGYLAAGYRFGPVMPMVIYSAEKGERTLGGPTIYYSRKAPSLALRYDAAPNVAIKAQIDRYSANDFTAFVAPAPAADGRKVSVFTVGVDFVF